MSEKTKICGWQPTGNSEDVPKPPKYNLNAEFWRTQWVEASGAHLMEYLRAEKLQEQLNTAKKALTEIINANDNLFLNVDGRGDYKRVLSNAREALAAIGGDDE